MCCEPIIKAGTKAPTGMQSLCKALRTPSWSEDYWGPGWSWVHIGPKALLHSCWQNIWPLGFSLNMENLSSSLPNIWIRVSSIQRHVAHCFVLTNAFNLLQIITTANLRLSNALSIAMQAPSMYLQSNIFTIAPLQDRSSLGVLAKFCMWTVFSTHFNARFAGGSHNRLQYSQSVCSIRATVDVWKHFGRSLLDILQLSIKTIFWNSLQH